MKEQIKQLIQIIDEMDSNPITSMKFFTYTTPNRTPDNTPPADVRQILITDSLHHIQHQILGTRDCSVVDPTIQDIFDKLNTSYQFNQNLCWKSHEHHFHPTFMEYVNCPLTCLAELSEFLTKLTKEIYSA